MHSEDMKFYKYLNPSSSLAVLKTGTLKWSSPRLFNDPFEFPDELHFPFNGKDLADAFLNETVRLAFDEEEPSGNPLHPMFAELMVTRRNANKPSEQEFRNAIGSGRSETADPLEEGKNKLQAMYRKYKDTLAVFCVSRIHDDVLMWSHYAQNHMGCVFKFRCLPEYDRPLCAAAEVIYQEQYPIIADLPLYVKQLTGQVALDYKNLFKVFAFTKSSHWSYEKEWRCVSLLRDRQAGCDFDPMIPEELDSIYLGCRIETGTKREIIEIINARYTRTSIFQAKLAKQIYALEFEQIR